MTNISEELTAQIAQKFFFEKNIYTNVFFSNSDGENELCDILIEFIDFYICIQVKGKNQSGKSEDLQWFKKTVLKKAIRQAKESEHTIKNDTIDFYTYSDNRQKNHINIDHNKSTIQLVVFCNSKITTYDRCHFSKSLNKIINIFSYEDFGIMLETISIPYDIVGYALQRSEYMPLDGGRRFIFEDLTDDLTLFSIPQTEKDYAEMYLIKNYYHQDIKPEYIQFYNEFLSMIYKDYSTQIPELFDMLFSADANLANRIISFYCRTLEQIKDKTWGIPLFAHNKKDNGILFIRKAYLSNTNELNNYINNFGTYFAYKNKVSNIYLVIFVGGEKDTFTMNAGLSKYDLSLFDTAMEKKIQELDELLRE
ncbi:MAG: hypothetical protein HDT28_01330 [Clostridiales bacterium]|nr:hypothetical protein [Clostridiales bacterium]